MLVTMEVVVDCDAHVLAEAMGHLRKDGPHIDVTAAGYDDEDRSYCYSLQSGCVVEVREKPKRRND